MRTRYVFDLDNTLIMTDKLNNISYNYALAQLGMDTIKTSKRITRKMVFAQYQHLTEFQMEKLIWIKQQYFVNNINPTCCNPTLTALLRSKQPSHCALWTSAVNLRVSALLRYYNLEKYFANTVQSEKQMLKNDIIELCQIFDCDSASLLFFEDDVEIINKLRNLGQRVSVHDLFTKYDVSSNPPTKPK